MRNAPEHPLVSVIIPARNAEANIAATLDSVIAQDYPGPTEIIVADGSDTPATSEIVQRDYPSVAIVPNPERTTPNALNAALNASAGPIVARCDCNTILPPEYLRLAVETLQRTGAAVVSGRQRPIGEGPIQRAAGMAITTPMGAGDARYRIGGKEGPVDTFYLGVYRRDALDAVGGFDPAMTKNQDCEFNWRQRKRGEQVWFNPAMTAFYRPRASIRAIARQYFDYGRWKPAALRRHPTELRARHLASPGLIVALAISAYMAIIGYWFAAALIPAAYAAALLLTAITIAVRTRDPAALLLPIILPTMHLSWGIGFFLPPREPPAPKPNPEHTAP